LAVFAEVLLKMKPNDVKHSGAQRLRRTTPRAKKRNARLFNGRQKVPVRKN
jgi:hypothetical protein